MLVEKQKLSRISEEMRFVRADAIEQPAAFGGRGRILDEAKVFREGGDAKLPQPVTVTVGENSAEARIVERTPQGGYSVVGVGAPPFARDDVELAVPVL